MRKELPELPLLLRETNRLTLMDGVLYRTRQVEETLTHQLLRPEELRAFVLKNLHDDMGHMGIDRTLDLVRSRFYWPRMAVDVERKIKIVIVAYGKKALPEKATSLILESAGH